ncbi:MAG: matrixin family metalloprotease [Proteobacteria bacterium]|nr:matrixin family metalloprotease [Pseudomonadota bacterium]
MKRLMLIAASLFVAAPAGAFEYMSFCEDEPTGVAWNFEEGPLTWHLSSTHVSTDLSEDEVRSAVLGAFNQWNEPACSLVPSQQGVAIAAEPFDETVDEVVIGFHEDAWPPSLGAGLLALTRIEFDATACELFAGDIAVNGADWTWVSGQPDGKDGEADLQAVMTHEVGHLLGLNHTQLGGSSMNFPYEYSLAWRTLGCDDSGGICDLYPSGDASCTDSAYCPCGNPCEDGFCDGLTFEDIEGECWQRFLPEESLMETEPNNATEDTVPFQLTGGDVVLSGSSLDCGNDGLQPSADLDWFNFDAPCSGRVFITLEPQAGDADVDLHVFDDTEAVADVQTRDTGSIEALEVEIGEDFQMLVYCWEGSATDYELRIQYLSPGEKPIFPVDEAPDACDCSVGSRPAGGAFAMLLVVLGLSRQGGRGRGVPSSPSA